jgi:hypothetical protein
MVGAEKAERRTSFANPLTPILNTSTPIGPPLSAPGNSPTSQMMHARARPDVMLGRRDASRAVRAAGEVEGEEDEAESGERIKSLRVRIVVVVVVSIKNQGRGRLKVSKEALALKDEKSLPRFDLSNLRSDFMDPSRACASRLATSPRALMAVVETTGSGERSYC